MMRLIVFIAVFLAIDLYLYWVIKFLSAKKSLTWRRSAFITHGVVTAFCLWTLLLLFIIRERHIFHLGQALLMVLSVIQGIYISKFFAVIFYIADDVRRLITFVMKRMIPAANPSRTPYHDNSIPRSVFLSWMGNTMGLLLFGTFLKGISNRYRYEVRRVHLSFANLPQAFHKFRIVHISDIHSGSFEDKEAVRKGVTIIANEKPDMIVFTGDLVNNRASEMANFIDLFSELKTPLGVYSILGNHDYGDYVSWESEEQKNENLEKLKGLHHQMGWRLLLNEHVPIAIGNESIVLLGIENWGAGSFSKYGKIDEAYKGCEKYPFKILLSHDPSHWNAQVTSQYKDIDLTLSGHTHGLQFGIETNGWRWSPAQWFYKQWAGLYTEQQQYLYVNRGFGFIGYHGRVGIMPEITLLEFSKI